MNIFFAATIRGGRQNAPEYSRIITLLERYGTILNRQVADPTLSQYGETDFTEKEIFAREMRRLKQADVIVAEVTTPSLGVGFLIAKALELHKPVLALYHGRYTDTLSAMIQGCPDIRVFPYQKIDELHPVFEKNLVQKNPEPVPIKSG